MIRQALAGVAGMLPPFKGRDRVLFGAFSSLTTGDMFTIARKGVRYEVRGRDRMDFYIMSRPYASPAVTERLIGLIGDRQLMYWDIGANIGSVLLPVLAACPNVRAVGFEPSPAVAGRLLRNLDINPELQARCKVLPTALTDSPDWLPFFPSNEAQNSGVGGLARAKNRNAGGPLVLAQRADAMAERFGAPDVIKIDVEGFEPEVLSGFGKLLDRDCCILFEHSLNRLAERGHARDRVVSQLRGAGFEVYDNDGGAPDLDKNGDFIAARGQWADAINALKVH